MGGAISKSFSDIFFKEIAEETAIQTSTTGTPRGQITEDPRSPATADVDRTPLPTSAAVDNQKPWDPRSPTLGIVRTPLHPMFDTPPDTPESSEQPALTGERTEQDCPKPVTVYEAEVHRSWQFDSHADLEEGDSMYPNPSSPPCDLSVEVSRSDCGSLENLLMYTVEGGDDSALASDASSQEPDVSPIGSPVKEPLSTVPAPPSRAQERGELRASTPNKTPSRSSKGLSVRKLNSPVASVPSVKPSAGRGLLARDTNSPLALVQRKQVARVNNQLVSRETNSPGVECNKENFM